MIFTLIKSAIIIFGNIFSNPGGDLDVHNFKSVFEKVSVKVYIIPGSSDPTSTVLPQSSFHPMLFDFKNIDDFKCNKKRFKVANYSLIEEGLRYGKEGANEVLVLRQLIKSRFLAPFCPDTLEMILFLKDDPFKI